MHLLTSAANSAKQNWLTVSQLILSTHSEQKDRHSQYYRYNYSQTNEQNKLITRISVRVKQLFFNIACVKKQK